MIKKLSGNSIRLGRFSRMVGCSLILILLLAGVGMSQAVAASGGGSVPGRISCGIECLGGRCFRIAVERAFHELWPR